MKTSNKFLTGLAGAVAASLVTFGVHAAAITGSSATIAVIAPPSAVPLNALESDTQFHVFEEQTTTVTNLAVNTFTPTEIKGTNDTPGLISGAVTSFFVLYDTAANNNSPDFLSGFLEFDSNIVGIIWSHANLDASDAFVGLGSTAYTSGSNRGLDGSNDEVNFVNANRIEFTLGATGGFDSIRVLLDASTETVSEPGLIAVFGLGLLALGTMRRRRAA